jgi:RNA polymerase sigma-70 factor (ECF subfamily)
VADGACLELAGKLPREGSRLVGAEEYALILRAQGGDRVAFDALVRMYDQKVLRLAMQVVRSPEEARDIFQEAFLKVYRSLSQFRFQSSFSTWLHRVVINVCVDQLRRQRAREKSQPPAREDGGAELHEMIAEQRPGLNPERALRSQEIGARIELALTRLNPRERMVFELRHYQGLRLRAIGELCGTSEETAKNCLFRATQKLRGVLSDLV